MVGVFLLMGGVVLGAQTWSADVEPRQISSGTRKVDVRLTGDGLQAEDLVLHTQVGRLSPLRRDGRDWVATLHLPPTLPPQRATVLVVHRPSGTAQLPQLMVTRRLNLKTQSQPQTVIVVHLDGKEVARAQTSDEGTASLSIDVPPDSRGLLELEHQQHGTVIHSESSRLQVGVPLTVWAVRPEDSQAIYVVAEGSPALSEASVLLASLGGTKLKPTPITNNAWLLQLPDHAGGTLHAELRVGEERALATVHRIPSIPRTPSSGRPFWAGVYTGFAADLAGFGAALVGADLGWRPTQSFALWLDIGGLPGASTRMESQQGMGQTTTEEVRGLMFVTVGGAWVVSSWKHASLSMGGRSGWATAFSQRTRRGPVGQITLDQSRRAHQWVGIASVQTLVHAGIGDFAVGPQLVVVPGSLGWMDGPLTAISLQAGFRFGIGRR